MRGIILWLEGIRHTKRRGHWPDWLHIGEAAMDKVCIKCLKGGRRTPMLPRLTLSPARLPL